MEHTRLWNGTTVCQGPAGSFRTTRWSVALFSAQIAAEGPVGPSGGETLENLIKRFGRLEVKLALEISTQITAGLAAVHKQKLVHRDIKPSNIMVSLEEGGAVAVKIIDLGLAKSAPDAPAEAAISIPGAFAGTPEFASPG
jgi:serine/threonine protein kinase